jgi:hypothetical protein
MRYIYCHRWSDRRRAPHGELTESEARSIYAGEQEGMGGWFSIGAVSDEDVLMGVLEVLPFAAHVRTRSLDEFNRICLTYDFKNLDRRLFLAQVTERRFPDVGRYMSLNEAVQVENIQFVPNDNTMKRAIRHLQESTVETMEYRDVDLRSNWEAIPEFGHWSPFVRLR